MMSNKVFKIIIVVALALAAGLFLWTKFVNKPPVSDQGLEVMKQSIIASANVKNADLTEEQKQKFLDELKKAQDSLAQSNFDHLQSVNAVGFYKKALGDVDGAITAWEYANFIRPKNSLSFSNLAALYHYDLQQYDKAEQNYLISIANDPDDINTIRNLYELYYFSLKDNAKTESLLLESIADNPQAPDLFALAGDFYATAGKTDKAIEYYQKAADLNPKNEAIKKEIDRLKAEAAKQ